MSVNSDTCLVAIESVSLMKEGEWCEYKKITVKQETGFWLKTFIFNMFVSHGLYRKVTRDMKLLVKVLTLRLLTY